MGETGIVCPGERVEAPQTAYEKGFCPKTTASQKAQRWLVEGDRGAGGRENRGREGYGRREERGREAGFPRRRETERNCEKFRNIA